MTELELKNKASEAYNILKAIYSTGGYDLLEFNHGAKAIYFTFRYHGIKERVITPLFRCKFSSVVVNYNIVIIRCSLLFTDVDGFIAYQSKYLKP